ncbi:MAG: hypothetical protein KBE07_10535 [Rhodoferax sp.]|nr:hypothetical protein [Rhodoferax sp.]
MQQLKNRRKLALKGPHGRHICTHRLRFHAPTLHLQCLGQCFVKADDLWMAGYRLAQQLTPLSKSSALKKIAPLLVQCTGLLGQIRHDSPTGRLGSPRVS